MKRPPYIGGCDCPARNLRVRQRQSSARAVRWSIGLLLVGLILIGPDSTGLFGPTSVRGEPPTSFERPRFDPNKANTSQAARLSAIAAIPFEKLSPESRQKVSSILSQTTLFRRMPIHVTQCDPDLHRFVIRHPDVLVGIWEELGVSDFRMAQIKPGVYQAVDGSSTVGTVEFVYQSDDTYVVYCEGKYRGPLLSKPLGGSALLILKTGSVEEADGRHYITTRLDTFTHVDNVTVDFLTRTFQPLVGKVVDNNFLQTSEFVGSLSRSTERNHQGVERLAGQLRRVRPEVRKEFATLAREIGEKGAARQASLEVPVVTRSAAKPSASPSRY